VIFPPDQCHHVCTLEESGGVRKSSLFNIFWAFIAQEMKNRNPAIVVSVFIQQGLK
jgi:hypothetical protein